MNENDSNIVIMRKNNKNNIEVELRLSTMISVNNPIITNGFE